MADTKNVNLSKKKLEISKEYVNRSEMLNKKERLKMSGNFR